MTHARLARIPGRCPRILPGSSRRLALGLSVVTALAACVRPGEDRARDELDVGHASVAGTAVEVAGGLAAVRELGDRAVALWCSAPVVELTLTGDAGDWTITAHNVVGDAELVVDGIRLAREPGERATVATFRVALAAGRHALRIAPPDAALAGPFRAVAMADIQTALPQVHEVFGKINEVAGARFVIAMGDLTERGELEEYALLDRQLAMLAIPFYTTLGNHELWGGADRFFRRFGRASFHFAFKGTAFSFADTGNAGIDPLVESWLDGWLAQARDQPHVFLAHIPPIDPVGIRYGAFRSARDGYRLLARLADGRVDLQLYGHIHTLVEYEDAGIPAFISGGGGAQPMRGDGIGRHFLVIDFDGEDQTVSVVRVDP